MSVNKRIKRAHERLESKRIGTFAVIYSAFLILSVATLQTTLFPYFSIRGVCFDATLLTAFFLAVYTNEYYGSVFGLILGVLADFMYPTAFPIMPVLYLLVSALGAVIFKNMKKGCFVQKAGAGIAVVLIRSVILALVRAFGRDDPMAYVFGYEIWHFLYTAALVPIFMMVCSPAGHAKK